MFDQTIFTPNFTSCILAHEQDAVKKLFRIVQRAHKYMPEELKPRLDRGGGSKYEFFFPDINSRIYCDLEVRGDTVQRLHVSEAAFMKDSSKLKATLQALPINGEVTIETTANGMANYFYDMWVDPDQPYSKMFFPWYVFGQYKIKTEKIKYSEEEQEFIKKAKKLYDITIIPEQIAFRRLKKAELKSSSFDTIRVTFEQEYPEDEQTCFLASGDAVLDLFKIKELIEKTRSPLEDSHGTLIYSKYDKTKKYVCGADVSEGVNRDFSVGVIIEANSRKVVAVLRGQWKPYDFAHQLNNFCKRYSSSGTNMPLLAVERNNHGHAVLLELNENIGYSNLYVHADEKLGWRTDSITRPVMVDNFVNAIENSYLEIPDKTILNECLTLINNKGKIEAADGKHDDTIIASAIALQLALKINSLSIYDDLESKILL
jgi:hypothetical protein